MSTLLLEELDDTLSFDQKIRIEKPVYIGHIRIWVYKHGTIADGELTLDIKDGATVLAQKKITTSELNSISVETYAHGYISFDFPQGLLLNHDPNAVNKEYTFSLYMDNHTQDANNFIGIVREWDDPKVDVYGDVDGNGKANSAFINPCGIEIFEFRSI